MFAAYLHKKATAVRRVSARPTDVRFSFLKALGIFFVVYGHVGPGVSLFAEDWFPQGPMKLPLFIFVSGAFYAVDNDLHPFRFLKKRALRLLIPYFVWNLLYGLLASLLRGVGLIRFGAPVNLQSLFVTPWINGHQFQFNIAAWFLPALFLVCCVFSLLRFCLKKLHLLNDWVLLAVFFLAAFAAIRFAQAGFNHDAWLILIRTVYFLPFFQMGVVFRAKPNLIGAPALPFFAGVFLLSAANVILLSPTGAVTVWCTFTGSAAGHLISVVLSILFWLKVADLLASFKPSLPVIQYVGDNTLSVMMHHAVVIFAINTLLYALSGPLSIGSFDAEAYRTAVWYAVPLFERKLLLFYIAAGIAVPCLGKYLWDRATLRLDDHFTSKKQQEPIA